MTKKKTTPTTTRAAYTRRTSAKTKTVPADAPAVPVPVPAVDPTVDAPVLLPDPLDVLDRTADEGMTEDDFPDSPNDDDLTSDDTVDEDGEPPLPAPPAIAPMPTPAQLDAADIHPAIADVISPTLLQSMLEQAFRKRCGGLILALEKATKGHGADSDRALMAEAAQLLRALLDLEGVDLVAPAEYGPVTNLPAIGHSLPNR